MQKAHGAGGFVLRLGCFAFLLTALSLWSGRHLRVGLGDPGLLTAFVATATTVFGLLDKMLESDESKSTKALLRRMARLALSTPTLIIGFVVAMTMVSSLSSVTVVEEGQTNGIKLRTVTGTGRVLHEFSDPTQFLVQTSPFGQEYELDVPGYLSGVISVAPLFATTVWAERELRRAPSVLFRPPTEALSALTNGGHFEVRRAGSDEALREARCPQRCSFLVGLRQSPPASWLQNWIWELQGRKTPEGEASLVLLAWSRPTRVEPTIVLEPGTRLVAVVVSPNDKTVVARAEFEVGTEALTDVPLHYTGVK